MAREFVWEKCAHIQILLVFLRFKLLPNFIVQRYRPQTWQFYLFFPALSISAIHEVLGIECKGGRSHDPIQGLFKLVEAQANKHKKKENFPSSFTCF